MVNKNIKSKINFKDVERIEIIYWHRDYHSTKIFTIDKYGSIEEALKSSVEWLNKYETKKKQICLHYVRFELNYASEHGELTLARNNRAFGECDGGVVILDMKLALAAIERFISKFEIYFGEHLKKDVDGPLTKLDTNPSHYGYYFCEPAESADYKDQYFVEFDVFDGIEHMGHIEEVLAINKEEAEELGKKDMEKILFKWYGPKAIYKLVGIKSTSLSESFN